MLVPLAFLSVVFFGLGGFALAQEAAVIATVGSQVNAVEVRVGAVLASNSAREEFDPRLVAMQNQFRSLFPYSSYRLVKESRQQVPWGGRVGLDIPGGRYLLVIPQEYKNDRVSMKIMLIEGARPIFETVLSLRNRGTLLVGGPRDPEGVLILSIGADKIE